MTIYRISASGDSWAFVDDTDRTAAKGRKPIAVETGFQNEGDGGI